MQAHEFHTHDARPASVRFRPLFEARWAYDEFIRLMPFGASSEGQAYAYSTSGCIAGEALSGSLRLTQYPRWRVDEVLLPDLHGLIETDTGEQVIIHAGGYALQVPDAPGDRTVLHWMRFRTAAPELAWLNATVAFGVGAFTDEEARLRYFAAAPAVELSGSPDSAPGLELLGVAQWEYAAYEAVRPFGDAEGAGYATSVGTVEDGVLAGTWRGWHYPTYLRDGLYQLDAHIEIQGAEGVILNRHGGLATQPSNQPDKVLYSVVQHATFVTEIPELAHLNQTLAIGVGFVRAPGRVLLSYYGLSAPN